MPVDGAIMHGLCLDCNYPLHGLESQRCPECGRAFDPADRSTFNPGKPMPRWMRWWLKPAGRAMLAVTVVAAIVLAAMPYEDFMDPGVAWWPGPYFKVPLVERYVVLRHKSVAALLWLALLTAWSCRIAMRWFVVRCFHQDRALLHVDRRARRRTAVLFLAGLFFAGCGVYDCWHAHYLNIWGFGGIAYSAHARPCYHQADWQAHLVGPFYAFTCSYPRPLGLHFGL